MALFKRNKGGQDDTAPGDEATTAVSEGVDAADEAADETTAGGVAPSELSEFTQGAASVPAGPYDVGNVPDSAVSRVDLGAMRVAGFTEMQLHFETDPQKSRFVSVLATYQDAALRLQPLAAPRSGGMWEDMREQIKGSIEASGGQAEEVEGLFGTELHAVVPAVTPEGEQVRQPIRLVAYEGPRWLLHGVFMGSAAVTDAMKELFEDVFCQTVVVRGDQPMAPGDVLAITLPPEAQAAAQQVNAQAQGATPPAPDGQTP
jgi:hypothetical protein